MSMLRRLSAVFGDPDHTEDQAAFIAEIERILSRFSTDLQDAATTRLIATFRQTARKPWPLPVDIIEALNEAAEAAPKAAPESKHPDWSPEALKTADKLMQSPQGRDAADNGYALGLWDHYRRTRRHPTPAEIIDIKRSAREFDEAYASLPKTGVGSMLKQLGTGMLARRQEKADLAHGVVSNRRDIVRQWSGDA